MELLAIIKVIEFVDIIELKATFVAYIDNQFVFDQPQRIYKLKEKDFFPTEEFKFNTEVSLKG